MIYGSWYMEYDTEFFLTLDHFLIFYSPNNQENYNFDKVKKNNSRYHFIHVYHKWISHDVSFLRYEA